MDFNLIVKQEGVLESCNITHEAGLPGRNPSLNLTITGPHAGKSADWSERYLAIASFVYVVVRLPSG